MSIERFQLVVSGIDVEVVRKQIKNLHLGVYPPNGRVRVAVPISVSDAAIRRAVIAKLGWIKRQRRKFESQERQSPREMSSGESHYFLGKRYRLRLIESQGVLGVVARNRGFLDLFVRPETTTTGRSRILQRWYRNQLHRVVPGLVTKWERKLGVQVADFRIKKMKTRWGTCNIPVRRIWLNLELVKKPMQCIEYIVVHEMAHLLERHHNDRFVEIMDQHLPDWRLRRKELNSAPLAHDEWTY